MVPARCPVGDAGRNLESVRRDGEVALEAYLQFLHLVIRKRSGEDAAGHGEQQQSNESFDPDFFRIAPEPLHGVPR